MSNHADFVALIFRLLKLGRMHDLDNLAAQNSVQRAVETIGHLTATDNEFYVFISAGDTIYVNGEPLKGTRQLYDNALEVGMLLEQNGFNELLIRRGVDAASLTALARRMLSGAGEQTESIGERIRLRWVDPASVIGAGEQKRAIDDQVIETYASAVVLSRRFHERVRQQDFSLARQMKRVAQHIVSLSEDAIEYYLAVTLQPATPERSRQFVHAAFASVLVARTITRDMHAMLRACYACMAGEIGNSRILGVPDDEFGDALQMHMNQTMMERVPASTATMLLQLGYASEPALRRTVTGFETEWLSLSNQIGWPHEGKMAPRPEALIAAVCRRFVELRDVHDNPDALFAELVAEAKTPVQIAAIKLLGSAIGYYPKGAAVALTDGHQAVVLETNDFTYLANPKVAVLLNGQEFLETPITVPAGHEFAPVSHLIHEPSELFMKAKQYWRKSTAAEPINVLASTTTPDPTDGMGTLEIKLPDNFAE